jgi:4-amino-4-deoxychorismate lyase
VLCSVHGQLKSNNVYENSQKERASVMYIYVNGDIVRKEDAVISPFDHGYMYGLGLFETFRIYNGHPFLLDDHLERLNAGLRALLIAKQFTRGEVTVILEQLLEVNKLTNAYVRWNVSAGIGELGLNTDPYENPTVICYMKPIEGAAASIEKEAVILNTRRNTPEGDHRLKSHHYLNCILGKREIGKDPRLEGIFLTKDDYVAEGIVSNIFWVKEETIYTPSVQTGILNGITRQFVITLAKKIGFEVVEGLFTKMDLLSSDEVFITNSIQEIVPIRQIDGAQFPGKEGAISQIFMNKYAEYRHVLWSRNEL